MRTRKVRLLTIFLVSFLAVTSPAEGQVTGGNRKRAKTGKAAASNAKFGWAIKRAKRTPGQPAKRVFGCETRRNVPETGVTMRRCPGLYGDKWFPLAKSVPGTGYPHRGLGSPKLQP
jgi:hypothetical protein